MKFLVLLSLFIPFVAHAEPPWNIDDPGTTPKDTVTFYGVYYGEKFKSESTLKSFPFLSLTWGALSDLEFGAAIPLDHYNSSDGESMGIGDGTVASKCRIWGSSEGNALALATQLILPTGDKAKNLGAGETIFNIGPTFQFQQNGLKLVGQVLPSRTFNDATLSWLYGLVLTDQITDRFFLGGQVFSNSPQLFVGVGGGWQLTSTLAAQLQFTQEVNNQRAQDPQKIIYAGFSWDFKMSGANPH